MVDVDNLSDAQLRTKLIEFGFPVMPITNTTRKIMVKKLKLLMENKSKVNNENRRSLARYSSEEESDSEVKVPRREKNRRATMAAPAMQPPASSRLPLRKSLKRNDLDNGVDSTALIKEETVTKRTTTKIVESESNDFDTGSDSEPDVVNSYRSCLSDARIFNKGSSPVMSSVCSDLDSSSANNVLPTKVGEPNSSLFSSQAFSSNSNASDYAADRLNSIRTRLSLGGPALTKPLYAPLAFEAKIEEPETPFLSNFTRRLSQLSTEKRTPYGDYKTDVITEQDTNGSEHSIKNYINRPIRHREFAARDYGSNQENSSSKKNNLVSFTVIGLAFLFFAVVSVVYLGLHSGNSVSETTGYEIPFCQRTDVKSKPGHNCVSEEDLTGALHLYKMLKPELHKRAVLSKCGDTTLKPYMTEKEIQMIVASKSADNAHGIQTDLNNFLVLIFSNPLWGLSIIQGADADNLNEQGVEDMETLLQYKEDGKVIALAVLDPDLPWRCSLYMKATRALNAVLVLACLSLAVYFGNTALKYYKQFQQKQKEELFFMVGRIVDILQSNANDDAENNYLVINHVRDMILPINDRQRMQKTWVKAVKFINENDSRVRTEIQVVQGEPYEVWRWLGCPSLNTSSARNKSWQGQAFEMPAGSVNSLQCSPTPCLKIRGMVEDGDRNLHTIREAVLSKCAHHCRILHCGVDTNSKCVYLKCADQNDAAIAYRNLHGWWYAGHLVTVKYLRLERYMQRYADSAVGGPPFLKAVQPAADWSN